MGQRVAAVAEVAPWAMADVAEGTSVVGGTARRKVIYMI